MTSNAPAHRAPTAADARWIKVLDRTATREHALHALGFATLGDLVLGAPGAGIDAATRLLVDTQGTTCARLDMIFFHRDHGRGAVVRDGPRPRAPRRLAARADPEALIQADLRAILGDRYARRGPALAKQLRTPPPTATVKRRR